MNTIREAKLRNHKGRTKSYYAIAALILALVAGHFIAQLTFIAEERWQVDEVMVSAVPVAEKPASVPNVTPVLTASIDQPIRHQVDTPPPVVQRVNVTNPDNRTERAIQKDRLRRPVAAPQDKAKTKAESLRLRRAEKLLTGF